MSKHIKYPNFNPTPAERVRTAEAVSVDAPPVESAAVMVPTAELRFLGNALQQLWRNVHGPGAEWRDVPTVEKDNAKLKGR